MRMATGAYLLIIATLSAAAGPDGMPDGMPADHSRGRPASTSGDTAPPVRPS